MEYLKLIGTILKSVNTDMKLNDILDYGYWFYSNSDMGMDKFKIPTNELSEVVLMNKRKGWILKMD